MRSWRLIILSACLTFAGCVSGYGGCLWVAPVKHNLSGHVRFRTYPAAGGSDSVPVLVLDKMAYIYSPAQSLSCLAADEMQLEGISEFPESVVDDSHVSVQGYISGAVSSAQHTRFVIQVITLLPAAAPAH